jgi:hypothetical protein
MSRAESPLPFFDAIAQAEMFGVMPVPPYVSGDGSRDVAADASGGNSVYVLAPPPPPRSPDIAVDTTTDATGADPAVRRPCTCRACARARADACKLCATRHRCPWHARAHKPRMRPAQTLRCVPRARAARARVRADARAVCLCASGHAGGQHVVARQAHPPQVWRVRCVHRQDLRLQYEHTQVLHRVRGTCLLHVASVSWV